MLIKKRLFQEISVESLAEVEPIFPAMEEDQGDDERKEGDDADFNLEDFANENEAGEIDQPANALDNERSAQRQREMLEEAHREAQEIIERSRLEAENITSTAQERAQKELERIIADRLNRLDKLAENASQELLAISEIQDKLLEASKPILLDLAIDLTQKIIGRKVTEERDILLSMLDESISFMVQGGAKASRLTLLVNKEDLGLAEKFAQDLKTRNTELPELQVKSGEGINLGSCIIESPNGIYDLSFSAQLSLFRERMLRGYTETRLVSKADPEISEEDFPEEELEVDPTKDDPA